MVVIVMFRMFQERLYHDGSGANVNDDGEMNTSLWKDSLIAVFKALMLLNEF